MSILIFVIILSVLIFVHELGHFLVAKMNGIRVDEFGLGYPPRARKLFHWKGTDFTLNWLPFGGFVKIFGENPEETKEATETQSDNFQHKSRGIQAAVLAAGVFFNFLFAWLLISFGFMTGISAPAGISLPVENPETVVTSVLPGSPAAISGIKTGDTILGASRGGLETEQVSPEELSVFIASSLEPVEFSIRRGDKTFNAEISPEEGIIAGKPAVGISMDVVGTVQLNPVSAVWHGLKTTGELTWLTAKALGVFLAQALSGNADLSQITGPVGIVAMVGDASELGFSFLLTFTAIISINLAIINLVPFPALDGGRLLFVGIEALTRRPVPARVFNLANTVGFGLLIFLMILITVRDVRNIL